MPGKKLVILSYAFAPSIGGVEQVSRILARIFAQRKYDVTVITETPNPGEEPKEPYRVVRRPGPWRLIQELRRADVVLQSSISLNLAWPMWLFFLRKPYVVVHHGPIARPNGDIAWQDRLKHALLWRPYGLSVSKYLASIIPAKSKVIAIPYDVASFRPIPEIKRDRELLFVGRLVVGKGADILLRAFVTVLRQRPETTLSIVGSGPEDANLKELAKSLGISEQVSFLGAKQGDSLARVMNAHTIVVVPSRAQPPEACPAVPVEGAACGCVSVASNMGGLPESVGDTGILFEEENVEELAGILLRLLNSPELLEQYRCKAADHIRRFHPDAVVDDYEAHFAACERGE